MKTIFPPLKNFNTANMATSVAVLLGLIASFAIFENQNSIAFGLLIICIGIDRLDGIIARKLNQVSEFGKEMDSLADLINFCLLPVLLAWKLSGQNMFIIPILCLYLISGMWRLAHFNTTGLKKNQKGQFFTGVPTTIAASWFVVFYTIFILFIPGYIKEFSFIYFLIAAILMISRIPYKKAGILTFSLYILLPASFVILFLKYWGVV